MEKDGESVWLRDVFAYDLKAGGAVAARDIVLDPAYPPAVYPAPLADLSHLEDKVTRYQALAVHPAGNKLLVRKYVGEDRIDATVSTILIDRRSGKQLLPVSTDA